jgi:hypothetical protein
MWNPHRSDLEVVDANAGGRMEKFKQKFAQFTVKEEEEAKQTKDQGKEVTKEAKKEAREEIKDETEDDGLMMDDYLQLLGQNVQDVQKGGKLAVKQKGKKK